MVSLQRLFWMVWRVALLAPRLEMWMGHWFRLWRPTLSQEDREDDDSQDRQELALPVLERFEPEV